MNEVYLLLGSNLGSRYLLLQEACRHINANAGRVVKLSSVYETQSWGVTDSPDYLNQVIIINTELDAHRLLDVLQRIERALGRKRAEKWGPRRIDIDILFYNNDRINDADLIIPHPELQNRRFTLEPLAELAPGFVHPVLHKDILTLKNELKDNLQVKKI